MHKIALVNGKLSERRDTRQTCRYNLATSCLDFKSPPVSSFRLRASSDTCSMQPGVAPGASGGKWQLPAPVPQMGARLNCERSQATPGILYVINKCGAVRVKRKGPATLGTESLLRAQLGSETSLGSRISSLKELRPSRRAAHPPRSTCASPCCTCPEKQSCRET